jgi:uroporphyrinogen-III synthase
VSRPLAVLRPEPGNAATCARIASLGLSAVAVPLFELKPVAWNAPDPDTHDALVLTSANALRMAGPELTRLRHLPVLAVGEASAAAARDAGFQVIAVGTGGVEALLALARQNGITRALHLAGRDRIAASSEVVSRTVTLYASEPLALDTGALAPLAGTVALLHSARAAGRLGLLVDALGPPRSAIRIAAISDTVAAAAGSGWQAITSAERPDEEAVLKTARALAD